MDMDKVRYEYKRNMIKNKQCESKYIVKFDESRWCVYFESFKLDYLSFIQINSIC